MGAVGGLPPDLPLSGKESFWDQPGVLSDKATVESNLWTEHGKASFLAAKVPHTVDTGFYLQVQQTRLIGYLRSTF